MSHIWTFHFINCIFQLQNSYWFFSVFIFLLNFSFCSHISSQIHWIIFVCFPIDHEVSLKLLFWFLYLINHSSSCLGSQLPEDCWNSWWCHSTLNFNVLWTSSNLLQFFTAFQREKPYNSIDTLRLSQIFCRYTCLILLAPCYGRNLSLVGLLWTLQCTRPSADSLFFVFFQMWYQGWNLWSLSGLQIWPNFCVCSLAICWSQLLPLWGLHMERWP